MHFTVALADRQPLTACFHDVMIAIAGGLRQLGHTAVDSHGFDPDRITIAFGYYRTIDRFPERSVVYQLEPVCDWTLRRGQVPVDALRRNVVWDYSRYNVEQLRRCGVEAHYVPIGHHPCLQRVVPAPEQDIDVLFYGAPTARRRLILNELRRRGLRTVAVHDIFGAALDPIIARAKVVLNIHSLRQYHPLESVRVGYLLSNTKAVVAELNRDDDDDDLAAGIAGVPYPRLVDTCIGLVRDDAARSALAAAGHRIISARPTAAVLDAVLHTAAALDPLAGAWGPRW
ncbi:hypothetical protein KO481_27225 [Nocardia sp. NEAU-G5]|uniref:Glycosyltransferase family 1 protein n=1 Tax=Nocardia albiluteola TaxID=2842303 RepID=A0ABS6B647_9NOCA|nr:hypothetical protein [Nocardia albiluteola]MBU3065206.1 hypothetical protein [Nocardia albiluteola]